MRIVVFGKDAFWEALQSMPNIEWTRSESLNSLPADADAYFIDEMGGADLNSITKPVFINSVANTLADLKASEYITRFNGWNGFIEHDSWEIASTGAHFAAILQEMGKKSIIAPDVPGFIAPRIIAMVVNEAFYAVGEQVSTPGEIDIAMKLGTNYPYGPFEWAKTIGLQNIAALLEKLALEDSRYAPAPSLLHHLTSPEWA